MDRYSAWTKSYPKLQHTSEIPSVELICVGGGTSPGSEVTKNQKV